MSQTPPPSSSAPPPPHHFRLPRDHDALPPGSRLGGYQLIEVLGRGGFGIVYLALDASLQRQVAIKEYLPAELAMRCEDGQVWVRPGVDPMAYGAGMKAFLSEAKMLARFDHPSLARVLSFWEENRSAYMVMPYYDGRTLAALLAEMPRPPDEAWLRQLLTPLLSALSALHNAQCLHLDISPDNIIVMKDGRPVLLDFGVASRLATDKTMPLTALLNPAYAPIEQYSESPTLPQGAWSDLYALASVLHFAIAGVPPARATVRAIDDPQRPLAEIVAKRAQQFPGLHYSASFLAAIDKALAVKPRERPRSAAEFQLLLDHLDSQQPAEPAGAAWSNAAAGASGPTWAAANNPAPSAGPTPHPAPPAEPPEFSFSLPPPSPDGFGTGGAGAAGGAGGAGGVGGYGGFAGSGPGGLPPEAWHTDQPPRALAPRRSRAPALILTVAGLALAAVAAWVWLQRQPGLVSITAADLPPSVVAAIPKRDPQDGAPGNTALPPPPSPAPSQATAQAPVTPVDPHASPSAAVPLPDPSHGLPPPAAGPAAPPSPQADTPSPPSAAPAASAPAVPPRPRAAAGTRAAPATPSASATAALPPEPNNPRAVCGSRTNFALLYCMQQQCKRWKFNTHPQCLELERRGEL